MKEPSVKDASQRAFWNHAKDQVVGQIFFAATTRVDTYKLKFNQVTSLNASLWACCDVVNPADIAGCIYNLYSMADMSSNAFASCWAARLVSRPATCVQQFLSDRSC